MILDRSRTGVGATDPSSADVASLGEVVVITVEVIHAHAKSTGPHELIHDRFFTEKCRCSAAGLIGVVASDHPLPGRRVVRPSNSGMEQEVNVPQRIG